MAFYIRNYSSEEKYDISKFLRYAEGTYDVLDSFFLNALSQLPTVDYYYVDYGYKEVDMISSQKYGTPFFAYLIQFYNGDFRETFPEGTILKLFDANDLNELYFKLSKNSKMDYNEEA